ncbi:MAG: hypothetical protein U9R57_07720 [Thermodesulfobacteriota bacterium]|nr:hypothetical protein [Thermodesulfobacteriota bacterium]
MKTLFYRPHTLLFAAALLFLLPGTSLAEKTFGGLTFIGDRQDICIEIAGECSTEDISFELATCDTNNSEKEKFKDRLPFTILVPIGTHEIVIKKNGKELIDDVITITPEKVREYKLP